MAATDLLQHQVAERPIIYAYSDTRYPGMLKVGFTARNIEVRMKEHYPTLVPGLSWKVELIRTAMRKDGSVFSDKAVHRVLRSHLPIILLHYHCQIALTAKKNLRTRMKKRNHGCHARLVTV